MMGNASDEERADELMQRIADVIPYELDSHEDTASFLSELIAPWLPEDAMGWANQNPLSPRTAALLEAWRTRPVPTGNEHDRLYAVMVHGYDRRAAEEEK